MTLKELLNKDQILLDIEVGSKETCIDRLTEALEQQGVIGNAKMFKQAVLKREEEGSTGIGFGVAIPHGKSSGVDKPGLAFARITNDLDWNSIDSTPVNLVFLIAVPEAEAGNEHLRILSQLSRKLMHDQFREKLYTTTSVEELIQSLE